MHACMAWRSVISNVRLCLFGLTVCQVLGKYYVSALSTINMNVCSQFIIMIIMQLIFKYLSGGCANTRVGTWSFRQVPIQLTCIVCDILC